MLLGRLHGDAADVAFDLVLELVDDADGLQILAQGKAPGRQQAVLVDQFEVADTGVIVVAQREAGPVGPVAPYRVAGGAGKQAIIRDDEDALGEA
jgi:hypothetical protein